VAFAGEVRSEASPSLTFCYNTRTLAMTYKIVVFGCAANSADAARLAASYRARGMVEAESVDTADVVVFVTCMIRQSAEDRVYGLVGNIGRQKRAGRKVRVIVTGCMSGMAVRDPSGKMLSMLKRRLPGVDEFLPIDEVGFEYQPEPAGRHGLVTISNGCNNYCTYCVVPYARGPEVSRPYGDILAECRRLVSGGTTKITLVGQNVNSYGSDLVKAGGDGGKPFVVDGRQLAPVFVKHLGKLRIPTLFPYLLADVASIPGLESVDFISSNPWDFSDELIEAIATHPTASRLIHLPVQSGDGEMLKRMNRWYTPEEYLGLIGKIRARIPDVRFSTDIIVGFCGETDGEFAHTVELCNAVGFAKAYIAMYSVRPGTAATKTMKDDVPPDVKKRRWDILDRLINRANLSSGTYPKVKDSYA
jgi:tRNA-2-methylthio-N6-dimethylallyladenosine synthase